MGGEQVVMLPSYNMLIRIGYSWLRSHGSLFWIIPEKLLFLFSSKIIREITE